MSAPLAFQVARPDDYPALGALSVLSYPTGADRPEDRAAIYRTLDAAHTVRRWMALRDGSHVGQYSAIAFTGWFGGVPAPVAGLAGVAVMPHARRTGIASAIVRHHLAGARDAGAAWALLHPFAADFYARFGYRGFATRVRRRLFPSELPLFSERARVVRLDLARAEDLDRVQHAYERFCVRTNGSLSRSRALVAHLWSGARTVAVGVSGADGSLDGYLLGTMHAPTLRPQTLVVPELVALDDAARRALYGFLAAQADQADAIELDAPPHDPVGALLARRPPAREGPEMPDGHQLDGALYSGAMGRPVDLSAALHGRGYPGGDGRAVFAARDAELPDNEAPRTLTVESGRPRLTAGDPDGTPVIRGEVGEIGRVLAGALHLADAVALGLVIVEERGAPAVPATIASLDRMLALPPPWPLVTF